eukprot:3628541-Pleurochrysis_carterae.AAC.5
MKGKQGLCRESGVGHHARVFALAFLRLCIKDVDRRHIWAHHLYCGERSLNLKVCAAPTATVATQKLLAELSQLGSLWSNTLNATLRDGYVASAIQRL